MVWLALMVLALVITWVALGLRPRTASVGRTLIPPEETFIRLGMSADAAFERCRSALEGSGAEVHFADPDRRICTAGYALGTARERLAIILTVTEDDSQGSCVDLDYKAASYSASHERQAAATLRDLAARLSEPKQAGGA